VHFTYTILYVENVSDTLAFYGAAFGLNKKMLHESGDYGELDTGATTLSFSSERLMQEIGKNPSRPVPGHPAFEIAFTTEDVSAAFAKALKAGAASIQEPQKMPWGQTTAYVADINGFLVELCTTVED